MSANPIELLERAVRCAQGRATGSSWANEVRDLDAVDRSEGWCRYGDLARPDVRSAAIKRLHASATDPTDLAIWERSMHGMVRLSNHFVSALPALLVGDGKHVLHVGPNDFAIRVVDGRVEHRLLPSARLCDPGDPAVAASMVATSLREAVQVVGGPVARSHRVDGVAARLFGNFVVAQAQTHAQRMSEGVAIVQRWTQAMGEALDPHVGFEVVAMGERGRLRCVPKQTCRSDELSTSGRRCSSCPRPMALEKAQQWTDRINDEGLLMDVEDMTLPLPVYRDAAVFEGRYAFAGRTEVPSLSLTLGRS